MNKIFYTVLSLLLCSTLVSGQSIIFSEDFSTVPAGTGYPASATPSVTIGQGTAFKGTANFNPFFGSFSVNNQQLNAYSVNGEVSWVSDPIDISCFKEVYFSATIKSRGPLDNAQNGSDKLDYVAIDLTFVEYNLTLTNFFSQTGPVDIIYNSPLPINNCGNVLVQNIVLTFRFGNDNFDEGHELYEVSVSGIEAEVPDYSYTLNCDNDADLPNLEITTNTVCYPEFSLDNMSYQSSGTFADLTPGNYTVYLRDHFFQTCTQTSFMISIPNCATVLPIELVRFTGEPQDEHILLHWETATEINNDYMAVERSGDGIDFREIGRVKGAGTTHQPQSYQFLDRQPENGTNYYRLRQVDLDGAATYHPIIAIDMDRYPETPGQIRIFPTVAHSSIRIELGFKPKQNIPYTIFSILGQPLTTGLIETERDLLDLPIQDLPAGSYIFMAVYQERRYSSRFVKQ